MNCNICNEKAGFLRTMCCDCIRKIVEVFDNLPETERNNMYLMSLSEHSDIAKIIRKWGLEQEYSIEEKIMKELEQTK